MMIGRLQEIEILNEFYNSNDSEFLAIYGRRRIGKTYLITELFKDRTPFFEITGMRDTPTTDQLQNYFSQFKKMFPEVLAATAPKKWTEALSWLIDVIEKKYSDQKVVLFFDELPWLASRRSGFLNALDHFWNTWASRRKNIKLIVCGSAASWMIKNIVHAKGGLHNRITRRIRLLPFTLAETEEFLKCRDIVLEQKQILDLFMVMGGVPHYLKQVEKGKSAAQNIDQICFSKNGFLANEFDQLFSSLFDHAPAHESVMRALGTARYGLTRSELIKKTKRESGGGVNTVFKNLEEAGFIARYESFGKTQKNSVYRINDEYSSFYLKWIAKTSQTTTADYWQQMAQTPSWFSWAGLSFEGICFKHIRQIKRALGIEGVITREAAWRHVPQNAQDKGAQIDLLIDRNDQCISVCEIKFSNDVYPINKDLVKNFENKLLVFRKVTQTKKSLLPVFITTFGVEKNELSKQFVQNEVVLKDLFQHS
jgi:AAA+ ATPase superfamily predicted ATPase